MLKERGIKQVLYLEKLMKRGKEIKETKMKYKLKLNLSTLVM
jgi:hypothetical protein